jgi:methylmalonyl-CoA/ethylmalonyl-CoA epimerase
MREPVFTETMQIGIVVRDLDAAMRAYVDDYGIGPWDIDEFNSGNVKDLREHGQPVERSWRLAVATVGQVQWELIEPLDDESVYARFLAEKGEGVHHLAVAARNFDETVAAQAEKGNGVVLSGEFSGIRVAYLATDRKLGVITEIFSGTPSADSADLKPDATYPWRVPLAGIVLGTLVLRTLLVPTLNLELDRRLWWPSRLSHHPLSQPG